MTTESVVVSGVGRQLDFVLPGVIGDRALDRRDRGKDRGIPETAQMPTVPCRARE